MCKISRRDVLSLGAGLLPSVMAKPGQIGDGSHATWPEKAQDSHGYRAEQYREMDVYFDGLIAKADATRAEYWRHLDYSSPQKYARSLEPYRKDWTQFLSVPPTPSIPFKTKRVKVKEFDRYTAYRVWFDALPGVRSYGILLLPKRPSPRAALIALHGHAGNPEMIAGFLSEPEAKEAIYRLFAVRAAERGYVVWCPLIYSEYSEEREPKHGPDATGRGILHKKAQLVGKTLMGLELAKLMRGVDFLQALPEVDGARVGCYGLSKGGHYTFYLAAAEPRIHAAVVSGWFNQRTHKLVTPVIPGESVGVITRVHRSEYYLPDLLNRFGDAELGWLIAPRAFMVENGTDDEAVRPQDAFPEFERVRNVYVRLGIPEKAAFAKFKGPHRIDGAESFPFLDRWLKNDPGSAHSESPE
jgi:dienelactone hydrolase